LGLGGEYLDALEDGIRDGDQRPRDVEHPPALRGGSNQAWSSRHFSAGRGRIRLSARANRTSSREGVGLPQRAGGLTSINPAAPCSRSLWCFFTLRAFLKVIQYLKPSKTPLRRGGPGRISKPGRTSPMKTLSSPDSRDVPVRRIRRPARRSRCTNRPQDGATHLRERARERE